MTLEQELKQIWDKYESQRAAERDAVTSRANADRELAALNEKRVAAGLPVVGEHLSSYTFGGLQLQQQYQYVYPPPKTWRDEMNDSMLAAIRKHFE